MARRILVLGAGGQLGTAFSRAHRWPPEHETIFLTRSQLNLLDRKVLESFLQEEGPFDALINTAVFMPVDLCEKESEQALQTNGFALFDLAQLCRERGILLIHFSTDYVFDGKNARPYRETDPHGPLNVYGRSKSIGERILESLLCPYLLIRSSWIFSSFGNNFVKKMWTWSGEERDLFIVDDQWGCPTFAGDVVEATCHMLSAQFAHPDPQGQGTFHLCGAGETTWYEFARAVLEEIQEVKKVSLRLHPISSKDFKARTPHVAERPAYAVLGCDKIRDIYGISQKAWRPKLGEVMKQVAEAERAVPRF